MKLGHLSQYFEAVAAKKLTKVEASPQSSNQHEFNGARALKEVLGVHNTGETIRYPTTLIFMEEQNVGLRSDCETSWYNSRFNQPKRSAEFRLYFPTTQVTSLMKEGDLVLFGRRRDGTLMILVAAQGSTIENQLLWLFNVPTQVNKDFVFQTFSESADKELDFASRFILEEIGIEIDEPEVDRYDAILEDLGNQFPSTAKFSELARNSLSDVDPILDPDATLVAWMTQEEFLFRRLERRIIADRIKHGFNGKEGTDVEGFLSFSMSVHQRRKARAGYAFENHIAQILMIHRIAFQQKTTTEQNKKPDFIFPSQVAYDSAAFPSENLHLLGAKTTLKERWRQIHSEAARIQQKHVITLEPGITVAQTDEMKADRLQLVVPYPIHQTYKPSQKVWLMGFIDFIELVKKKQITALK